MSEPTPQYATENYESLKAKAEDAKSRAMALAAQVINRKELAEEATALAADVKKAQAVVEQLYTADIEMPLALVTKSRALWMPLRTMLDEARRTANDVLLMWKRHLEAEERTLRDKMRQAQAQAIVSGKPAAPPTGAVVAGPRPNTRKEWRWRVTDLSQVPDKYKEIDAAAVTKAVDAGTRNPGIPGVDIYEDEVIVRGR